MIYFTKRGKRDKSPVVSSEKAVCVFQKEEQRERGGEKDFIFGRGAVIC